jgi:SAM-dependent methyltransferase
MADTRIDPAVAPHGVAQGFTRGAGAYDDILVHNATGARRLVAAIPEGAYGVVLDVGCGTGFASIAMRDRFHPRRIIGVDPSEGMLEVFRAKLAGDSGTEVELHATDVMSMPVPDASVDAVVSAMAFHWFPDKPGAVAAMARTLRPGGVLAILASGTGTDREFEEILRAMDPPVPAAWVDVFDLIHRDVDQMRDHLEAAGLEVEDVWIESRRRRTPPEHFLERIRLVASHLSADMPPGVAAAEGERVAAAVVAASGPDGFRYTFNKLFAVARRPG